MNTNQIDEEQIIDFIENYLEIRIREFSNNFPEVSEKLLNILKAFDKKLYGEIIELNKKQELNIDLINVLILKEYHIILIEELVDYGNIEMITKFKQIYNYYNISIKFIPNTLSSQIHKITLKGIKWLEENENDIFYETIEKLVSKNCLKLFEKYELLKFMFEKSKNKNELHNEFVTYINNLTRRKLIHDGGFYLSIPEKIFDNIELVKFLIELYLNYGGELSHKELSHNELSHQDIHFKTIKNLIIFKVNLKNIIKYISWCKVVDKDFLIKKFEKNYKLFINICSYGSVEYINWYLDYVPVITTLINPLTKKCIFKSACISGNLETAKHIYDLLMITDQNINKKEMENILSSLMFQYKYNNNGNKKDYDSIIKEIINLNIKPYSGYPQYKNYYSSIRIIK